MSVDTAEVKTNVATDGVDDVNCNHKCPICLDIMINPITTPCKHTFCTGCIAQVSANCVVKCPICRQVNNSYLMKQNDELDTEIHMKNYLNMTFIERYDDQKRADILSEENELAIDKKNMLNKYNQEKKHILKIYKKYKINI